MKMLSLEGKSALVNGGSGLHDKQIVNALAQAGAGVYVAARNLERNRLFDAAPSLSIELWGKLNVCFNRVDDFLIKPWLWNREG